MAPKFRNTPIFTALLALIIISCSTPKYLLEPAPELLTQTAPEQFSVKFTTTKGDFVIKATRENSPLGVDRFYYLCKHNYFKDAGFFRVVPDFVVQFGLSGDPLINKVWENLNIPDEPVKLSNKTGTIAFARAGKDTRSIQFFINLKDNIRLDETEWGGVKGFPAFGEVVSGMETIQSINSEYREQPNQDSITVFGNKYLKKNFPNLDYILGTEILD